MIKSKTSILFLVTLCLLTLWPFFMRGRPAYCKEDYYGVNEINMQSGHDLIERINLCLPGEEDQLTRVVMDSYLDTKFAYCAVKSLDKCLCPSLFRKDFSGEYKHFKCVAKYKECIGPKIEELSIFESNNYAHRCAEEDAFETIVEGQRDAQYWTGKIYKDNKE